MPILEIACFSVNAAQIAANHGAHRIEYSVDYEVGGVSPKLGEVEELLNLLSIPVHVLVRSRPGNFVYTKEEIDFMSTQIEEFNKLGVKGIVTGAMLPDASIDIEAMKKFKQASGNVPLYFHRAFDEVNLVHEAIEQLLTLPVKGVLTHNFSAIKKHPGSLEWIAGGGIRAKNVQEVFEYCKPNVIHSAALKDTLLPDIHEVKSLRKFIDSCA